MALNTSRYSESSTIVAYFNNPASAERAMSELRRAGFRSDQIGCSCDEDYGTTTSTTAGTEVTGSTEDRRSFWDKVSDFFTGNDESTEQVSERHELRVPESYYNRLSSGGAFVSVYEPNRRSEAEQILRGSGGEIETNLSAFQPIAGDRQQMTGERRIQLLSERLKVRKERVSQGDVRLRKEVHTEQKNINVPVTREELVVEHVPTSERSATGKDIGHNEEIRVPLSEEHVRVEKEPVVRDEVRVAKRPIEEVKNVSDEVRHEELRVEDERKRKEPKDRKTA